MIALLSAMMVTPATATTWDVYEGQSIQDAINNAVPEDTVFVHAGTYVLSDAVQFCLFLDKQNITLKGEGADMVTLDNNGGAIVIGVHHTDYNEVDAHGCVVEGFTMTNSTYGVLVYPIAPHCIIRNNVFDGFTDRAFQTDASNTIFEDNIVTNTTGKYTAVYVGSISGTGSISSCVIANNTIIDNKCTSATSSRALCIRYATNCIIANNIITGNNGDGIRIWTTTAADNTIKGNNISSNTRCGICLKDAGSGNKIYLNDIVDNPTSVIYLGTPPSTIYWNSTEPIEYTYGGSPYTNYLGNYWSDYGGVDTSPEDGIGDTSYDIPDSTTDKDFRPLMQPFESYFEEEPAPEFGCVANPGTSEAGTVYGCGDLVNCSCTFNGNLTCNPAGGLIVNSNGIVIDGSGYTITGTVTPADCEGAIESSPCTVSGIYNAGYDDVVIQNLEIENFCTGIALAGTGPNKIRNNTIDNCSIHDNGFNTMSGGSEMVTHGIHACNIDGAVGEPALTITNNEIYNNEGTGCGCGDGGNGIFILAGSPGTKHEYCNISCNKLYGNAKAGFWTKMQLTRSNITHNEIWGNGNGASITDTTRGGIVLRCKMSDENYIAYNNIHDHVADGRGYGMFVGGGSNIIEYNTVTNNSRHGISMARSDGSHNNELYKNTVCDNGVDISTFGPSSNTIGDNNTCDTTADYDDDGTSGCTYSCTPPTPLMIYGWVNCTDGSPVNDPDVTVTNTNTSEVFIAETNASSNYYRISTSSDYMSAWNVLHFVVSSSNSIEFNHTVTTIEMDAGGFTQNATIECGQSGICGDVTCNGVVDTGDVILLANYVGYYPGNPAYVLNSTQRWAGDVTGNCVIDTGDVILLSNHVGYPGYALNCNSSCIS